MTARGSLYEIFLEIRTEPRDGDGESRCWENDTARLGPGAGLVDVPAGAKIRLLCSSRLNAAILAEDSFEALR